jgi:hypothetical protein
MCWKFFFAVIASSLGSGFQHGYHTGIINVPAEVSITQKQFLRNRCLDFPGVDPALENRKSSGWVGDGRRRCDDNMVDRRGHVPRGRHPRRLPHRLLLGQMRPQEQPPVEQLDRDSGPHNPQSLQDNRFLRTVCLWTIPRRNQRRPQLRSLSDLPNRNRPRRDPRGCRGVLPGGHHDLHHAFSSEQYGFR